MAGFERRGCELTLPGRCRIAAMIVVGRMT
jgi:hypothetical protein